MRKTCFVMILLGGVAWLALGHGSGPAPKKADGWIPLFNGKDLTGWYTYFAGRGKNGPADDLVRVHDGVIHIYPEGKDGALYSATDQGPVFRSDYFMRVSQTWEQISLILERRSEAGGLVRLHSDMASIRIGMMAGVDTLRFVYTFEENLPRREGVGSMARQFSGAATLEFRRDGDAWRVTGHFFDDIGRSGQISLRQGLAGIRNTTVAPAPPTAASSE